MIRHRTIVSLLAAALLAGCASMQSGNPDTQKQIDSLYVLSEIALSEGRTEDATQRLIEAARLDDNPYFAERAARLSQDQNFTQLGLAASERWRELAPDDERAYWFSGIFALRAGQLEESVAHMTTMLQTMLPREPASNGLALILDTLGFEPNAAAATYVMSQVVEAFPGYAAGYFGVARLAMSSGDFELALENARRATELEPDWPEAQLLYARALLVAGRTSESLALAAELASAEDATLEIRQQYAELLLSAGRSDQARGILDEILRERPGLPDATRALAFLTLSEDDLDAAEGYFGELRVDPDYGLEAFFYLGRIAESRGSYLQATRSYGRVVEGVHAVEAQVRTARIMMNETATTASALQHLEEFGRANPVYQTSMLIARSELLMQLGRTDEAETLIDEAVQASPSNPALREAHVSLYLIRYSEALSRNAVDEAQSILEEALQQHPGNRELRYSQALLFQDIGDFDGAADVLEDLAQAFPNDAAILNALGYLLTDQLDEHDDAHEYIRRALAMDPDNAAIIDSMGWVLYKLGDYEAALDYLERAYRLVSDPEMAAHLIDTYWALGNRERALELLEQNVVQYPDSRHLQEVSRRLLNK